MKVPLAVLADYANVTADGKLNIMGIFNLIYAPTVPTVHPQMRLVMRFQSEPAERGTAKEVEVKLLDADGQQILGLRSTLNLPPNLPLTAEIPQVVELNGLKFEKYGDYGFHILVNGETKIVIPFTVAQPPSQAAS